MRALPWSHGMSANLFVSVSVSLCSIPEFS
jgi:hypothetical protein